MSKLTDPLKYLVSMCLEQSAYLIASEIKQLLPAAKLIQKYSETLFITVLIFKSNSLYFAFFCRPIALPNFVNLWCSVLVVFCFILKHPKIFIYCCADEKYSVPGNSYLPTLNLQNFAELLEFIRFTYILFFEEELTRRPSCLSGDIFMVFRSFSSCNMEYNLYVFFFYEFVDARQ